MLLPATVCIFYTLILNAVDLLLFSGARTSHCLGTRTVESVFSKIRITEGPGEEEVKKVQKRERQIERHVAQADTLPLSAKMKWSDAATCLKFGTEVVDS